VDDNLECPFHAWRFNTEGHCVHIPYCEDIPKRAQIKTWPVCEVNGLIYVFHDRDNGEPDYDVPVLEGHDSDEWLPWTTHRLEIKTHPKEIVENVVDIGHFSPVHRTEVDTFENEFIDHMAIQRTAGTAYPVGGGVDKFKLTATYYGPAFQISEMDGVLKSRLLNSHTPIDENTLHLRFGVSLKILGGDVEKTSGFALRYVDNLEKGFGEDIEIWEEKLYRETPILCKGDGPIVRLRNWYAQFYAPRRTGEV
jgi:3-ketosteroid 9alpha-monooxygenase subunit A